MNGIGSEDPIVGYHYHIQFEYFERELMRPRELSQVRTIFEERKASLSEQIDTAASRGSKDFPSPGGKEFHR